MAVAAAVVIALWVPHLYGSYRVGQLSFMLMYAVAILGLNLTVGFSGQITLGHSAFFAIGAYTSATCAVHLGWPVLVTIPLAAITSFIAAIVIARPAVRLKGLQLGLVTFGLVMFLPPLLKRFDSLTGGASGLVVSKPKVPTWLPLEQPQWIYYVCLTVAGGMFLIARNLTKERAGREMLSVLDNATAAAAVGVDVRRTKQLAFAWGGLFAGVSGSLFVIVVGYVSPDSFTLGLALAFFAAAVVGGLGRVSGSLYGAVYIVFAPAATAGIGSAVTGVVNGLILIVLMMVMPKGFAELLHLARGWLSGVVPQLHRERRRSHIADEAFVK